MIKKEILKSLLELNDQQFKKVSTDQLRTLLGVLRYSVRIVEREINKRFSKEEISNGEKVNR